MYSLCRDFTAPPTGFVYPGLEFSGQVIAVGPGVVDWKAGDKVMGATKFGGYVSHINIHHRYIISLPAGWNFEEGAELNYSRYLKPELRVT